MSFVFANFIKTTLAANVTSTATSIQLSSSANLPVLSAGQILPITLNDAATGAVYEIVYCTAISGAVLTVTRGQENTTAVAWLSGDTVFGSFTAETVFPEGGNTNPQEVGYATTANEAVNLGQLQNDSLSVSFINGAFSGPVTVPNATTTNEAVNLGQTPTKNTTVANVTSSRQGGVLYTNSNTTNLYVWITSGSNTDYTSSVSVSLNGSAYIRFAVDSSSSGGNYATGMFIVPPGWTYEVSAPYGFTSWVELS